MDEAKNTTGFKIVIVGLLLVIVILAVTSFFLYNAYERNKALFEWEKHKVDVMKRQSATSTAPLK
jgi:hypothetical protein